MQSPKSEFVFGVCTLRNAKTELVFGVCILHSAKTKSVFGLCTLRSGHSKLVFYTLHTAERKISIFFTSYSAMNHSDLGNFTTLLSIR